MAGLKQSYENAVLNHFFRAQSQTSPSAHWIALYTTAPTDTTEGTEVSGGSYARQSITFGAPSGNPAQISNSAQILFPEATANWGTVVAFAIHTAATGSGNQILWGNFTQSKTINAGDQALINAGNLTISCD